MKLISTLLINKDILNEETAVEYAKFIESFLNHVDKLYIYNILLEEPSILYEKLKRHNNIEITNTTDLGEAKNYERMLNKALSDEADYAVVMELGYYYEEDCFLNMKKFISDHNFNDIAVYTPLPLYGCQLHERKSENVRFVMGGCKLIGSFINMNIYKELGIKTIYYQSMFDYDYCIRARLNNYKILLFNNEVLRNINYRIVEKKLLFINLSTYDIDPLDIYYNYRNRLFLWKEYQKLDLYYVKLDKKIFKQERHEMRWRDPGYREKIAMFEKAKEDFKKGLLGKIKYDSREIKY